MQRHNPTFIDRADETPLELNAGTDQQRSSQHALHAEIARLNSIIQVLTNHTESVASSQEPDFILSDAALADSPGKMAAVLLANEKVIRSLRESEAHFRQLFERHSAVMLLIDHQSLTIVDANPAATQFYGYCELSASWSHFVFGVMAPVNFRHKGATLCSA